jgi:hypothetical protein
MPTALVEASFMSNPEEDLRLASLAYNKLEAKAIATGILNYFRVTRNISVDFTSIFAPLDEQAEAAQAIADATIVRKELIEKRSLFGRRYMEVTYDATGRVISRREVGSSSESVEKNTKSVASSSRGSKKFPSAVKTSGKNSKDTGGKDVKPSSKTGTKSKAVGETAKKTSPSQKSSSKSKNKK